MCCASPRRHCCPRWPAPSSQSRCAATQLVGDRAFWLGVQNWWIGDFLGALIVTPLVLTVGFHGFALAANARGGRAATLAAFGVLLVLLGAVFLRRNGALTSPLDVPYIVYPVLVWIAMLSGPRRTALAAGITVPIASLATTRGFGPFDSPYQLQTFLALCVLPVLLLQAVMAERDDAIAQARSSDERYRAFIANSSEAIFRMRARRAHADHAVARRTGRLGAQARLSSPSATPRSWWRSASRMRRARWWARGSAITRPGRKVYIERIREAIRNGYQVRNIEHVVHGPYGLDRVLLISMIGIVENGHVLRFWGTGRDVTAMREAENALAQHDAQLRALATEITLAEERARRKLASELHDGPAQNLAGMAMQLAAIKRKIDDREQVDVDRRGRTGARGHHAADAHPDARARAAGPARNRPDRSAALARGSRRASSSGCIVSVEDDGIPEAARGPGHGAAVPDRARAAAERGQTCALQARHGALRGRRTMC